MQLFEPQWWISLLETLNAFISVSQTRFDTTAFWADFIVFLFPVFLIVLYILGIKNKSRETKLYALYILIAAAVAAIINIVIQQLVTKARPETVLTSADSLILKHLPTMSFPSDHAAVSMAFAVAILLWAFYIQKVAKNKKEEKKDFLMKTKNWRIGLWWFFLFGGILMAIARVAVGIHWPTDILAWRFIGLGSGFIAYLIPQSWLAKIIFLQEWIFKKLKLEK